MRAARLVLLALVVHAVAAPGLCQSLAVLRDIEDRLLQRRIDAYREAHRAEQEAATSLQTGVQRLYVALGDRSVDVDALRALETEVSLLREAALLRSRESTDLRLELYGRMERLEELERELLRDGSPLQGTWILDLGGEGLGTVSFFTYGGRVEATYELGESRRGTLRGVLRGNQLDLERIDSQHGLDRAFLGRLAADGNSIEGTWQAKELAAGEPAAGRWTARRAIEGR
ncbi:MAG TPA: hypothetical protein VNB06_18840 [Thermoanaerobaculia bacterium]|nr:hypothetical protein [Thermoanaerobaculia bacterium]